MSTNTPDTPCYLRYRSRICPNGRKPITKRIVDLVEIKPEHALVAIVSPARAMMYLLLDRNTEMVWLLDPDAPLSKDTTKKRWIGVAGEFLTL